MANESKREEFTLNPDEIVAKIKQIIKEGNAQRIIIQNEEKETIMEIPLTVAIVGTILAPVLAAVGALTGILTKCTVIVEKK